MSVESLKVQNDIEVKLDKLLTVQDVDELFFEKIFLLVIAILDVGEEMYSESFDLIPDGVKFLEVIFKYFILRAFNAKFIPRDCNFINLKILFLPDQHFEYQPIHRIFKHMAYNLMQPLNGLQLDDIRRVGLDDSGDHFEAVLDDLEEVVRGLVGGGAGDGDGK